MEYHNEFLTLPLPGPNLAKINEVSKYKGKFNRYDIGNLIENTQFKYNYTYVLPTDLPGSANHNK